MSNRFRRRQQIRAKIFGTSARPRLSVFRSLRSVEAQLVDDVSRKTLAHANSRDIKEKNRLEAARLVGVKIGKEAQKNKIKFVIFDRSGYAYHGRVKALAEGARSTGLKF